MAGLSAFTGGDGSSSIAGVGCGMIVNGMCLSGSLFPAGDGSDNGAGLSIVLSVLLFLFALPILYN
jgi:hypothetical protein